MKLYFQNLVRIRTLASLSIFPNLTLPCLFLCRVIRGFPQYSEKMEKSLLSPKNLAIDPTDPSHFHSRNIRNAE